MPENYDVKIFTDKVEEGALKQIQQLMEIDVFKGCKVRIMPDVHAGAGCVIGFTGDLEDKVIPNIVGVDIGCGIMVQPFECRGEIDFHRLHNTFKMKRSPVPAALAYLEGQHREDYLNDMKLCQMVGTIMNTITIRL